MVKAYPYLLFWSCDPNKKFRSRASETARAENSASKSKVDATSYRPQLIEISVLMAHAVLTLASDETSNKL